MNALPRTMKAVVTHGPQDSRLEQVPIPRPGDREVLLKVLSCGICAGDLKAYQGGKRFWGGGQFTQYIEEGSVGGHEFIGEVAAVGLALEGTYKLGEWLIAEQIVPCGHCAYCRNGKYWLCEPHEVFGFKKHINGGFAEYILLPEQSIIHRVPTTIPIDQAALIEPLSCSLHAIDRARLEPDDLVVLSGCGPLGLGMLAWMKAKYQVKVLVVDPKNHRLAVAQEVGADYVANPQTEDIEALVLSLSDGLGCDVYIEAAGHPSSVTQGFGCIRKAGRFVEFSVFNDNVTADFSIIGDAKELDIYGVSLSPYCYERTIKALEEKSLKIDGIVTHIFPLEKFDQAFTTAFTDSKAIKVLLKP